MEIGFCGWMAAAVVMKLRGVSQEGWVGGRGQSRRDNRSVASAQVKLVEELTKGSWGPRCCQSQKWGVLGGDGGGAAGYGGA